MTQHRVHRVWFKVILNPILRNFGCSIVSVFENNKFVGYRLREYPKYCGIVIPKKQQAKQIEGVGLPLRSGWCLDK